MSYGKKDEDADLGLVKVDRTQVFQEGIDCLVIALSLALHLHLHFHNAYQTLYRIKHTNIQRTTYSIHKDILLT